jgi:hypothetical protein
MLFAGKWMELEDIILTDVSQVQKDKEHCFLSYVEDRSKKINIHTKADMIIYTFIGRTCV